MSARAFEIQGWVFELSHLELPEACRGVELVAGVAGAGFGAGSVAAALATSISKLPALVDLFAPCCKVQCEEFHGGKKLPLATFKSEVFSGRLDLAILFAANCAALEFGDFLGEGLSRLQSGLEELLVKFPALKAPTPSSGG